MMVTELKPCPFCGAPGQLKQLSRRWAVECSRHCVGTRIFNNKQTPADVWNRRTNENENNNNND